MFCTDCGAVNPDSGRYCHKCGSALFQPKISKAEADEDGVGVRSKSASTQTPATLSKAAAEFPQRVPSESSVADGNAGQLGHSTDSRSAAVSPERADLSQSPEIHELPYRWGKLNGWFFVFVGAFWGITSLGYLATGIMEVRLVIANVAIGAIWTLWGFGILKKKKWALKIFYLMLALLLFVVTLGTFSSQFTSEEHGRYILFAFAFTPMTIYYWKRRRELH